MEENLPNLKFQKKQLRSIEGMIKKAKERISELYLIKNQLWSSTINNLADRIKKRFIISKITRVNKNPDYLNNISFIDSLAVCYYSDNAIKELEFRELARSDPWRLIWTVGKDRTPLFKHSASEMTENQSILVMWSKIYDFAFESMNRPSDEIIASDIKFDAWYASEIKRLKADSKGNDYNSIIGDEVFIAADEEGSKEVFDMNSAASKAKIRARDKLIQSKGVVSEMELPDVRDNLQMAINRLSTQNIGAK